MAENLSLATIANLSNSTTAVNQINSNFTAITNAFVDVYSRSGISPNQQLATMDMNGNQIINLPSPASVSSPVRLQDVINNPSLTVPPVGTSGATVPFLNGNNTWSGTNNFTAGATIPFQEPGTGSVATTVDAKLKGSVSISVIDFGADPTGAADSTTAIQNAINSLPATGGIVLFPVGTYKISSTVSMGNGTGSGASTKTGIILQGMVHSVFNGDSGMPSTVSPTLLWNGGSGPMVEILGPLDGWGIYNLEFNANGNTTVFGLGIVSASFGECRNCTFYQCFVAINSITFQSPGVGGASGGSFHNNFDNIVIQLPAVANSVGVKVTNSGNATVTTNTAYMTMNNFIFQGSGGSTVQYGIVWQVCDSCTARHLHFTGGTGLVCMYYDYTINNNFPGGIVVYGIDPNGATSTNSILNNGTPGGTLANYIYGVYESNGGFIKNFNISNVYCSGPTIAGGGTLALTGQTASIANTTLWTAPTGYNGLHRINYYLACSLAGSSGTVTFQVNNTDAISNKTQVSNALNLTSNTNLVTGSFYVETFNGNPTYSTTVSGAGGSPQYNLYVTVEKLF